MSSRRLKHCTRAPSALLVGVGSIQSHRLTFKKKSQDGSGKCDAQITCNPRDRVFGVIWEIPPGEKKQLDSKEGLGHGYAEKTVDVTVGSQTISAVMYYATDPDEDVSLRPYHWYKRHVIVGAREHRLPEEYIACLETVPSIDDQDADRIAKETALYEG